MELRSAALLFSALSCPESAQLQPRQMSSVRAGEHSHWDEAGADPAECEVRGCSAAANNSVLDGRYADCRG